MEIMSCEDLLDYTPHGDSQIVSETNRYRTIWMALINQLLTGVRSKSKKRGPRSHKKQAIAWFLAKEEDGFYAVCELAGLDATSVARIFNKHIVP
jgi:hypothetical protein